MSYIKIKTPTWLNQSKIGEREREKTLKKHEEHATCQKSPNKNLPMRSGYPLL